MATVLYQCPTTGSCKFKDARRLELPALLERFEFAVNSVSL